jgi:hypothetical protein
MLKNYNYIEFTSGLCPVCLKKTDAKIIEESGSVFVSGICNEHGQFKGILEEDADYYRNRRQFDKPANKFDLQTEVKSGCPYDCGLCPQHEQHTCVGLIEITQNCNLACPLCFAESGKGASLSLEEFDRMLDFYVESEGGSADIIQISGGEPTIHPEIIKFIETARAKNINYVMLNTNGLRIAEDIEFVKELSNFKGGFEVYLQFDGFDENIHKYFRGKSLSETKLQAVRNLDKYNIPITLVTTIEREINDKEISKIIEFGLNTKNIRGISFQPVAYFGRLPLSNPANRLTLTGIIQRIEEQTSSMIKKTDFIPLPCDIDRVAITYFFRDTEGSFIPLTRKLDLKQYLPIIKNTFKFDPDDFLKELSLNAQRKDCCNVSGLFKEFAKYIPYNYLFKTEEEKINFVSENTFRISITSFVDAFNFDIKSLQKECIHFITPDLKKIPFSAYNLLHRKTNGN